MEVWIMTIEPLSDAVYHDIAKNVQRTDYKSAEGSAPSQNPQAMHVGATETPAVVQTQGGGKNQGENGGQKKDDSDQKIMDAVNKVNEYLKVHNTRSEFTYHKDIHRVSIKIIDEDTDEVIREIPSAESIDIAEKMWEMAGIFVDEKR
jgi:flagellar protein FlaG